MKAEGQKKSGFVLGEISESIFPELPSLSLPVFSVSLLSTLALG